MILSQNGSFEWSQAADEIAGPTNGSIDLPADLVAAQPDLIDRVIAFAFDVLEFSTLDLRIRVRGPKAEG